MKLDNSQWTVEGLRKAGFKVRVTHYRMVAHKQVRDHYYSMEVQLLPLYDIKRLSFQDRILAKGGLVEVSVLTLDNQEIVTRSECCVKDWYNNKVGVRIALARAMGVYNKSLYDAKVAAEVATQLKALENAIGGGTGT